MDISERRFERCDECQAVTDAGKPTRCWRCPSAADDPELREFVPQQPQGAVSADICERCWVCPECHTTVWRDAHENNVICLRHDRYAGRRVFCVEYVPATPTGAVSAEATRCQHCPNLADERSFMCENCAAQADEEVQALRDEVRSLCQQPQGAVSPDISERRQKLRGYLRSTKAADLMQTIIDSTDPVWAEDEIVQDLVSLTDQPQGAVSPDISERKIAVIDAASAWAEAIRAHGPEAARPFRDNFTMALRAAFVGLRAK